MLRPVAQCVNNVGQSVHLIPERFYLVILKNVSKQEFKVD